VACNAVTNIDGKAFSDTPETVIKLALSAHLAILVKLGEINMRKKGKYLKTSTMVTVIFM
jgi:hypothetical protein